MEKRKQKEGRRAWGRGAGNQGKRGGEVGKIIRKKTRSDNAAGPPLVLFWAGQKTRERSDKGLNVGSPNAAQRRRHSGGRRGKKKWKEKTRPEEKEKTDKDLTLQKKKTSRKVLSHIKKKGT